MSSRHPGVLGTLVCYSYGCWWRYITINLRPVHDHESSATEKLLSHWSAQFILHLSTCIIQLAKKV